MDIAQYVGLFLIKNEYCYMPGIGSLQIDKKPAKYNAETKEMNAPEYEITFQKNAGSIDDSFANFIATNERISIAHASNYFKDYCASVKSDIKEGKDVIIPGIGKLFSTDHQTIQFEKDANLQIKGKSIPFFKVSPEAEKKNEETISNIFEQTAFKEPNADEEIVMKAPQVNWTKIILLGISILAIIGLVIYFILSSSSNNKVVQNQETQPALTPEPIEAPVDSMKKDSTHTQSVVSSNVDSYLVLINAYPTKERAERRVAQLKSYGHTVSLNSKDSLHFNVVMTMPSTVDTTQYLDSLGKLFGSKIHILK